MRSGAKMTPRGILLLAAVAAAVPAAATAEIAVLSNGRALKISAYEVGESVARLSLVAGGEVELPVGLVERIVDDEIVPADPVPEIETRSWRFDEASLPMFGTRYDAIIVEAAKKFDVDAALVSAVIKAESDYDARAVSHKGARGLMQLMPATARRFGVADAFDPHANVHAGTRYLRWLLDRFGGDVRLALAGYNAGEGNVARYSGVPPFRETREYIRRIARHLESKRGLVIAGM